MKFDARVESLLGSRVSELSDIPSGSGEYARMAKKNCENMIGTVSIPVGITRPLLIHGKYAHGKYIVPLATTEGCLVASISRGAKALTLSGGVRVTAERVGITRAPVFRVESEERAAECAKWIEQHLQLLKDQTQTTSRYLELLRVATAYEDGYLFLKFFFDSKDAMGMNMATVACDHLIRHVLEPQLGIRCIAVSGNYCSDKKPARINAEHGRGFQVKAEALIPAEVIADVLKTTPQGMEEVYRAKIVTGSRLAGSLGANAHAANMIAAIFLATGQDPAHVVEGANAITTVSVENTANRVVLKTEPNDALPSLRMAVTLPSLVCGVIGGGTGLPKQREALRFLGIEVDDAHPGRANHVFAEIVGATVLAGELSLLAALSSRDLATAHDRARRR